MKNILIIIVSVILFGSCNKSAGYTISKKGEYGENILDVDQILYNQTSHSLAIEKLENTLVKIEIRAFNNNEWQLYHTSNSNWKIEYNHATKIQTFRSTTNSKNCDLEIDFEKGTYEIFYYIDYEVDNVMNNISLYKNIEIR